MTPQRRTLAVIAAVSFAAFVLIGCGSDTDTGSTGGALADGDRVEVEMADLAFDPSGFRVERGATVTFVFDNTDAIDHEALIGDGAAQDEHEAEMTASGGEMSHGDEAMADVGHGSEASGPSGSVLVAPGERGEITYTFEETGTVLLGCHQSGHYDGGMQAIITVT